MLDERLICHSAYFNFGVGKSLVGYLRGQYRTKYMSGTEKKKFRKIACKVKATFMEVRHWLCQICRNCCVTRSMHVSVIG